MHDHKTVGQFEVMMIDAVCKAEPLLQIEKSLKVPKLFLKLTDYIEEQIENSENDVVEFYV